MTISKEVIMWLILGGLVLSAPAVFAEPPDDRNPPGEKMLREKMEVRKQQLYKDLNLTETQQKALEENKKSHHEQTKAVINGLKEKRMAMQQALQEDKLDIGKIYQLQGELKALQGQMYDQRLEGILEVRKILTLEQFKKFIGNMEKRPMGHLPSEHKGEEQHRKLPPPPPDEGPEGGF